MVVLSSEVFFDLDAAHHEAVAVIDRLIAELRIARDSARDGDLRVGSGGLVENPTDLGKMSGHWWIDSTDAIFTQRFEAIELDGSWRVLDHKHPEYISPEFSETDAKAAAKVWSAPGTPSMF